MEVQQTSMPPAEDNPSVVHMGRRCQSADMKWLCIPNIYERMHRSAIYNIGGSLIDDVADYWFTCKTEQVHTTFLLHMFLGNNSEGVCSVGISAGSEYDINKKNNIISLDTTLKYHTCEIKNIKCQTYITTYSFTEQDVDVMKGKKLYIAVLITPHTYLRLRTYDLDRLREDYDCRELLHDPAGADFIIMTDEGVKFNVHKILLTAHSEVFKAMLKPNTVESQNGCVTIKEVEEEELQAMVQFLYVGSIDTSMNINYSKLLVLADRYDLKGLRELSSYALSQQLSEEDVIEILIIADLHCLERLKVNAMKFIKDHQNVLSSPAFKELNNPSLLRELCSYLGQ